MKKLIYFLLVSSPITAFSQLLLPSQTPAAKPVSSPTFSPTAPEITFAKTSYFFGRIKKGTPVVYKFYYTNTGQEPLIIYECKAGCVCTSAKCSKDPVKPGEGGFIEVHYDSIHVGTFAKDFFIKSNAKNGTIDLIIRGIIEENTDAAVEPAPAKSEEKIKSPENK